VIVKFDKPEEISKDYGISEKLYETKIPNFIKYYCMFSCNENMDRFDDTDLTDKSLCRDKGIKTGFIVIPYYDTGSVKNYSWDVSKFKSLKNVLCQAVLALCSSYVSIGFVHGDMHLDNIVLRKTKKKTLLYKEFEIILKPEEFYAIILDFGRSNTRGNFDEFMSSIWTMICLTRDIGKKSSIILDTTGASNHIRTMKKINKSSVAGLLDKINSMKIDYVKRT
jgi:serine/threonine protein kinase